MRRGLAVLLAAGVVGLLSPGCGCGSFVVDDLACAGPGAICPDPGRVCAPISTGEYFCVVPILDAAVPPDGGCYCDDGNACNGEEVCLPGGGCLPGLAPDCSALDDLCNVGVCDVGSGTCVPNPRPDGTLCDDGEYCTDPDFCDGGVCTGAARDCATGGADPCTASCDELADTCVAAPSPDGTACSDGAFCTVGESCAGQVCGGGVARNCGALDGPCVSAACDEATDLCVAMAISEGVECQDGLFCTLGEICAAGVCTGGTPNDCSGEQDQCNVGQCNEGMDVCVRVPLPDGTLCDDETACTSGDRCVAGRCMGTPGVEGPVGDPSCSNGLDDDCDTAIDGMDPSCNCDSSCASCDGNCCIQPCSGNCFCPAACACDFTCSGSCVCDGAGASCTIFCPGSCTPSCINGASCALECATGSCSFDNCDPGPMGGAMNCPGGARVCNRPCP